MSMRVPELDPEVYQQAGALIRQSKQALECGNKENAALLASQAWELVPNPKYGWDSSLSLVRSLVRLLRESERYNDAIAIARGHLESEFYLEYQYHPYFLLGTVHYAMGELENARECFLQAHRIGGARAFLDEPKEYLELVRKSTANLRH